MIQGQRTWPLPLFGAQDQLLLTLTLDSAFCIIALGHYSTCAPLFICPGDDRTIWERNSHQNVYKILLQRKRGNGKVISQEVGEMAQRLKKKVAIFPEDTSSLSSTFVRRLTTKSIFSSKGPDLLGNLLSQTHTHTLKKATPYTSC